MSIQIPEARSRPAEHFRRNGWAIISGLMSGGGLAELCAEADRLSAVASGDPDRGHLLKGVARSDRLDPVVDLSPAIAALARNARMSDLAAEMLGGNVQLFKDKLILKPPGARGYEAHQDAAYWPHEGFETERMVTIAVFLDAAMVRNGAVECASGKHEVLLTKPGFVDDLDDDAVGPFTTVEAAAGDALLIHSLTPHRSGPNLSATPRRALFLTYGIDRRPELYRRYQIARSRLKRCL